MTAPLRHLLKCLIAFVAMIAYLQPCLCEPCGLVAELHAEAASDSTKVASSGCCPGSDDDESSDDSAHDCQHCDEQALYVADVQIADDDSHVFAPPHPGFDTKVRIHTASWFPPVEPIVVRRANPPPEPSPPISTNQRLAHLASWLC